LGSGTKIDCADVSEIKKENASYNLSKALTWPTNSNQMLS
jgi:hypothetical protein